MGSSASLMAASESTASTRARTGGAVVRQGKAAGCGEYL